MFQVDALSPLLFVIAMMLLRHILRRGFTKSQKMINSLMYMDNIKVFAKKMKKIGDSNTINKNLYSTYRDGIWLRKICHAHNEKWKTVND